jgi:hypothetical protein
LSATGSASAVKSGAIQHWQNQWHIFFQRAERHSNIILSATGSVSAVKSGAIQHWQSLWHTFFNGLKGIATLF